VTTWPAAVTVAGVADLATVSAGAAGASTVADEGGDTGGVSPGGGVAVAVAVFAIDPASISACVTA
jgi:hypothetical protein